MKVLDEHGSRLYATLVRLTLHHDVAGDLLQELFVRLGSSDTFQTARDPAAFAWRTALNLATQWRRERKPAAKLAEDIASSAKSPLDRMVRDEELSRLLDGLDELSEMARVCFVLRFIERQSYDQIGRALEKTPHQVRGHCHAAVKQLREKLATEEEKHAQR